MCPRLASCLGVPGAAEGRPGEAYLLKWSNGIWREVKGRGLGFLVVEHCEALLNPMVHGSDGRKGTKAQKGHTRPLRDGSGLPPGSSMPLPQTAENSLGGHSPQHQPRGLLEDGPKDDYYSAAPPPTRASGGNRVLSKPEEEDSRGRYKWPGLSFWICLPMRKALLLP